MINNKDINNRLRAKTSQILEKLNLRISLVIFSVMVFNLNFLNAQSDYFKYYEIHEISSKELIKSISKDEKGFVWLATDEGVLRFDGTETLPFYKEFNNSYTKAFLERKNRQFLVLYDHGLREVINNEDTTYFQNFNFNGTEISESFNYPKSIFEDKNGNVWIGEYNAVVRINERGIKRFELGSDYRSISYHRSFAFAEDAFGHLWIAPYKGRLLSYNEDKEILEDVNIDYPVTTVSTIVSAKGDHLLIGGKEGLLILKIDSDKNILSTTFIESIKDISVACTISNEIIYIGTWFQGLYIFDLDKKIFKKVEDPPFHDILDLHYIKSAQELWIAGSENIGLLKGTMIKPFDQIGKNRIESIDIDENDDLYYSIGQQIYKYNGLQVEEVYNSKNTFFNQILKEDNILWIGDAFGSIFKYDMVSRKLEKIQDNTLSSITHIIKDSNGNKWFSGSPDWVTRIDQNENYITYNAVKNSVVTKESPSGVIYSGAQGNHYLLYQYDQQEDKFLPVNLNLTFEPNNEIRVEDMDFDQDGNLWLATDEGLIKVINAGGNYRAKRIVLEGFPEYEAYRAIKIVDKNIWLANDYGLLIYNDDHVMLYNNENGLPSKILKDRGLSVCEKRDKILIATAKGLATVDKDISSFKLTPKPIFKSLVVNQDNIKVANTESFVFPAKTQLQTEFNTLSYPGHHITYQTRILGINDTWSNSSANKSISVLGFEQGNYTLEIRARNSGYLWSEPLQLNFTILPAWYNTWWAYLIFAAVAALLIFLAVKLYNTHLIRQKKKLKKIIEERTEEINRQKNEIIDQKNKIIQQKEELLQKNKTVLESQQALSEADLKYFHLKEKQLQDQIEFKNKQITTHTLNIIQKNETLRELRDGLENILKSSNGSSGEIKKTLRKIDESFKLDKDWEEFKLYFEQVYTGFYTKLKINYSELSNQELRHCALIRLNLSIAECASILGISPDSVKVSRTRIRKKLNLKGNQSLSDFILSI